MDENLPSQSLMDLSRKEWFRLFIIAFLTILPASQYHMFMRIGMLADVYKPYISGITNYIDLHKRHFERAGHEVQIFTFGDPEYQGGEERVLRSPGLPLGDTGYYFALRYTRAAQKLLRTMDIVHVHHPFLSGRLAIRYCKPLHIPSVFTNHTRYDLYAGSYLPLLPRGISDRFLRAYMPAFCEAMSLVVSPSAGMANILRRMGVSSPIEIIPNGIELDKFYTAKPCLRSDFGLSVGDIVLVYAGRLASEKNLSFLLQSFARVAQTLDNVYLLMVGGGRKQYMAEIENDLEDLHLQARVRITGKVSYEDLPSYLAMCDIFVTASVSEVHPLSVIEAMASGLPVLGIQSPGISDTIEDGKTGFLASEGLAAFSAKLTRLCLDHDLRHRMGTAARQASSQYAIERTTHIMLEQYERLVKTRRPN
jgi:1,2-diacylglycerol 3-alpha-glucosyltransferase